MDLELYVFSRLMLIFLLKEKKEKGGTTKIYLFMNLAL